MAPNNVAVAEMNAVVINNAFDLMKKQNFNIVPSTNGDESFKFDELLKQMEEEAAKLCEAQTILNKKFKPCMPAFSAIDADKAELDKRSIFVGNVDYSATNEILKQHFMGCGLIERITIKKDNYSGKPKGFAYMQFADVDSMQKALAMDQTMLLGRQIMVVAKRTNKPGISTTDRAPRGRSGRGRGFGSRGQRSAGVNTDSAVQSRGSVPYYGCYRGKRGRRVASAPY